jgi:hypothetical protein
LRKSQTYKGLPHQLPAVLCSGASPGAPKGKANGNYRTGHFTCEAIAERRQLSVWIRAMAQLTQEVE